MSFYDSVIMRKPLEQQKYNIIARINKFCIYKRLMKDASMNVTSYFVKSQCIASLEIIGVKLALNMTTEFCYSVDLEKGQRFQPWTKIFTYGKIV